MKPYGIPRDLDVQWPDVGSIQHFGLASHVGKFPEKCGVYKPYVRNTEKRNRTRRYWKRTARMTAKHIIFITIKELDV